MNLTDTILTRLKQSEFWTPKTKEGGNTTQGLTCPACGVVGAAWCYTASPMSLNCNRLNQCGARTKTIELFNIRKDIEREFKPTKTDPKRPARAYLESRGIKQALKGLKYYYQQNVRNTGSGAVMFPLGKDQHGKTVANGRLINPPPGAGKTHNSGSTSGMYWVHPGLEYDPYKPTYVVEGIIDALSLIELGQQAIAVLAAGQDPTKLDLAHFKNLVPAFDNDLAGTKATRKWINIYPDLQPIIPDKGIDWNDLLCSGPVDQVKRRFAENLPRYLVNAQLALSESAQEYSATFHEFFGYPPGIFTHDGCTYFSFLKKRGDESRRIVERCGKFTLKVISYRKDTSNPENHEYRYHLEIQPKGGRPVQATASGRDLATPRGLKEFFLTRAKVAFEANANAATAIATLVTSSKAPEVLQLSLTGYDRESQWYIYRHFAIDPAGKLHRPDKRGLYKLNHRDWVAPPAHAADKSIKPAEAGPQVRDIHRLITAAWGDNGAAALAWTVAGWLVNQIKEQVGFFPFLSLHGDPASGKSALTVMLNAIQGVDGEGIPLSQLNTKKALARSISRVSGLFTALLEDNERNERAFDYSILLTGYNSGPLQLKAAFSNDNRVTESPFLSSLLFVQNTEPFNQKAEKQRVISLHFNQADLTEQTRAAYEELIKIPLPKLARVLVLTLQQRKVFEEGWLKEYHKAIEDLLPMENRRILQNHALLLAFHRLFCRVHGIKYSRLTSFMLDIAHEKCRTSAARDYSLADHFFETIDLLDKEKAAACLHLDPKKRLIYINLPGIEQLIRNKGIQFSVNDYLTRSLMQHPAYVENSKRFRFPQAQETDSRAQPKQRRVWVFDADRFE